MDEEAHLRKEVKRLEAEKTIRVNNFKKLALVESSLCDTLKMVRTQMVKNIPSEADIAKLATRIEDMEREFFGNHFGPFGQQDHFPREDFGRY